MTLGLLFMNRRLLRRQEQGVAHLAGQLRAASRYVTWITFTVLFIAMTWTVYFLVLGVVEPDRLDYAQNVSQLIVSVVTVFSIIVAFYQFLRERPS